MASANLPTAEKVLWSDLVQGKVKQGLFSNRGVESGKGKVECYRREGGYDGLPDWYKSSDWKISDKCISGDMLREYYTCEREQKNPELGIRSEWAARMHDCAKKL